ncbi:MAG: hypothetical protein ACREGC_01920 [Minisyncoccia bacterium]
MKGGNVSFLIKSAAFFKVCECGKHGHIVFSNRLNGLEVCSIEGGMKELKGAQNDNRLFQEEVPELKRQILRSSLPREDKEIGILELVCVGFADDPEKEIPDEVMEEGNGWVM